MTPRTSLLLAAAAVALVALAARFLFGRLRVLALRPILFADTLVPAARTIFDESRQADDAVRRAVRRALFAWQAAQSRDDLQPQSSALLRDAQRALRDGQREPRDRGTLLELDARTRDLWRQLATPLPSRLERD